MLAADLERPRPEPRLREAHRVEQHPPVLADVLARLEERLDGALPREVACDAVLRRFEYEAHLPQPLDDLDPERAHARVHTVSELT